MITRSFLALSVVCTAAQAATVPFVEDFPTDSSNWYDQAGVSPLDWAAAGGPDGSSYVFTSFSLANAVTDDTPTLFRAQDKWGSSGGAFEGDWIADGVVEFRAFVRHDAPFPLTFYGRFASPFNFPGAVGVNFVPVFPNTWTEIVIAIDPFNPQFITFEGSDFNTVFSNIGHVQIGVSVADGQGGFPLPITVDVDQVTILGDCAPDCAGRACGPDGCGGSCGTCEEGQECSADGQCAVAAAAVPTTTTWGMALLLVSLVAAVCLRFRKPVGA